MRYRTTIGAANTVWFQGSLEGVSTAAAMKMMRIAYLMLMCECAHRGDSTASLTTRSRSLQRAALSTAKAPRRQSTSTRKPPCRSKPSSASRGTYTSSSAHASRMAAARACV